MIRAVSRSAQGTGPRLVQSRPRDGSPQASERAKGATLGDIFLARLGQLEKGVEEELGRRGPSGGPLSEFVMDLASEAWRGGTALFEAATTSAGRRRMLADWTAASPVDELGLDSELAETTWEILRPLARRWLGLREQEGAGLPETGGVLVLLNRSGWPLPVEALVLGAFLCDGRVGRRRLAVLWDDGLLEAEVPYLSDLLRRLGVVAATAENASALLERGAVVLAFPEGRAAIAKTYDRRYRLARFEGKDLLAAAVEASARIVPGAVIGVEESFPILGHLPDALGSFPVTAQFPLLGPFGLLPLPATWKVRLGAPIEVARPDSQGPSTDALADAARARMQAMIGELLSRRERSFGG